MPKRHVVKTVAGNAPFDDPIALPDGEAIGRRDVANVLEHGLPGVLLIHLI
jgi:hypothetical protein